MLISIYIPTHNRLELLKRAVGSVLNQTYKSIEVIICDDGSSDGTKEYLHNLSSCDSRVKYIRNEKPKGACNARNNCINIAKGEYITGLDDDDYFHDKRIEIFINKLKVSDCNLLSGNVLYKNLNSETRGVRYTGYVTNKMIRYRNIIGNQIFCRTRDLQSIGGFDESLLAWQDYDVWIRLIDRFGPCYRLPDITYTMDLSHEKQRITTGSKSYEGYLQFINKHKSTMTKSQLRNLFLEDLKNRGQKVTFKDVIFNFSWVGFKSYLKDYKKLFL